MRDGEWTTSRVLGAAALAVVLVVAAVVTVLAIRHDRDRDQGGPTPRPTPTSSPGPSVEPTAPPLPTSREGLLRQRVGFGAKVDGGAAGPTVTITSAADSGPGSLRAALEDDAPRWIVFAADLTIQLTSPIAVGSNKTIDGRGHDVVITGPDVAGLVLSGSSNVILESLTLTGFGDTEATSRNDPDDAVLLDGATGVWIDHCDLSLTGDKLIGVTGGSSGITVSWNHFHDQEQVFQIGNQSTGDVDVDQTVTVHHNYFDETGYRNPVVSYGRAHVFNNYYREWRLYGVRIERAGQVYLERNVFVAGRSKRAVVAVARGDGCNDSGSLCDDRPGYLRAVENLAEGSRRIVDEEPDQVFDPAESYTYSAETADASLADLVATYAGPY